MNTQTLRRILALQCTVALILVVPLFALGAESTSYKLYSNLDESDATPLGSSSYTLQESGGTWTAQPLTGSNFQIVTAPPSSSSSNSSSVSQSEVSESTTNNGQGGGGRGDRSEGPLVGSSSSVQSAVSEASSSQESSVPVSPASQSSVSSADASVGTPIDASVVTPTVPTESQKPSASEGSSEGTYVPGTDLCTGETCMCECPAQVAAEETHCAATERFIRIPVLIPTPFQSPMPSMFVLIIAYILGYGSKITRSGQMQISSTPSKKPHSKPKK